MKITDKTPLARFLTPNGEECTIHVQATSTTNVARVYEFPKVYRNSGEQRQVVKCELSFYWWTTHDNVPNEVTVRYPKDAKLKIYKFDDVPAIVNEEQY